MERRVQEIMNKNGESGHESDVTKKSGQKSDTLKKSGISFELNLLKSLNQHAQQKFECSR